MRARGAYTHAYRGYIDFLHRICTSTIAPDRRIPMEREKDIEAKLRRHVNMAAGMFMKFVSPGNDGVPDRIVLLPWGRTVFVELKTNCGKLSKIQKYQIWRLLQIGQNIAVLFGPDAVEDFINDLRGYVEIKHAYYGGGETELLEEIV